MKRKLLITLSTMLVFVIAYAADNHLRDEGVGMYTDASVANQVSTFTINRQMVSCGVAGPPGSLPGIPASFAMLMFSTDIDSYRVDRDSKTIRATGRMRSITRVGATVAEDVEHDFLAIAVDGNPDRFDIHFSTPLWNPGNPLCTPSTLVPGKCRFGGALIPSMGDVVVK